MGSDHDLDIMRVGQTLSGLTARILDRLESVLEAESRTWVIVQGTHDYSGRGAGRVLPAHPGGPRGSWVRTGDLGHPSLKR